MTEDSSRLRIGGVTVDRVQARADAKRYLSGQHASGYPAYDSFDAGAGPWRLSDGDLLAPALLNVTMRIPAFYALSAAKPRLEQWLRKAPVDARLVESGTEDLKLLADLFAIIDDGEVPGVGGTTLAKVMHRKRPAFVPLHDRYVWRCYVSQGGPVPPERHRTWQVYMPLLAAAMVEDMRREGDWLTEIAALAAGPVPVTTLRALDIVAWRAGRNTKPSADEDDLDPDAELGEEEHEAG